MGSSRYAHPTRLCFSHASRLAQLQHYGSAWTVHFIDDDCRPRTRYFNFATLDSLRSFVTRCQPEDTTLDGFEHSVRAWARGSECVHLTEEQYGKLMTWHSG